MKIQDDINIKTLPIKGRKKQHLRNNLKKIASGLDPEYDWDEFDENDAEDFESFQKIRRGR